jgi:uncharacterized protein (TIGR02246 family)
MRIVLTALLVMTALSPGFAQIDDPVGKKLVDEFAGAVEHNDVAALDRLMTSDYKFVTPTGAVQTKEGRLAPMRSGDLKYESVVYDELDVRRYGDTVVVIARVTVKGHMKTTDVSGQFRATLVLKEVDGRWQLVSSQSSPMNR